MCIVFVSVGFDGRRKGVMELRNIVFHRSIFWIKLYNDKIIFEAVRLLTEDPDLNPDDPRRPDPTGFRSATLVYTIE